MAALPQLITVEQFRQLPEGGLQFELHFGEVVAMARPTECHSDLQHRLLMLLSPLLADFGVVRVEYPYRPLPEFEFRAPRCGRRIPCPPPGDQSQEQAPRRA